MAKVKAFSRTNPSKTNRSGVARRKKVYVGIKDDPTEGCFPCMVEGKRVYIGIRDNPSEGCLPGVVTSRRSTHIKNNGVVIIEVQGNTLNSHRRRRSLVKQRISINKVDMDEAARFVVSDFNRLYPK